MDKNSVTGLVLIGLLFFGFTFYQSKQYKKQAEFQAQLDSIAAVEQYKADSIAFAEAAYRDSLLQAGDSSMLVAAAPAAIYKDSLLNEANAVEESTVTLSNDLFELAFTTKGAQPLSARLKEFTAYGGGELYLFKPGMSHYGIEVFAGEIINTSDFNFVLAEQTDTSVAMMLPFSNGGYIEQRYSISEGSYSVNNQLSFVGMEEIIPKNVSSFNIDFFVTVPRLEKGYKNEVQYSKLAYYFNGEKGVETIGKGRGGNKRVDARVSWFDFQQQFFSLIMRAPEEFASADFNLEFKGEEDEEHNLMTCEARLKADFNPGSSKTTIPFEFYIGPNSFNGLKAYDHKYEKVIPLGGWLVGWFTRFVIIPLFNFLHRFISNFGIIILLMTIFIKLVVLPLSYKSYASSAKMQAIKPEIDQLNKKYPKQEDAMKKQQAQMDLYKRAGISPMGGCLPTLLQFPILWAMFRFFPASIELRQQSFLWADDLSAYDSIVDFGGRVPLIGDHLSLFALLMAVSMFFYSKATMKNQPGGDDPNMASMRFMSVWMMPIMMFFICNNLSSGLSYYYLLSNLIMMLETFIIKKFCVNTDEIRARLKATEGKKPAKSKWQQRLEEAQKMSEQMRKEQQKNGRR